MYSRLFRRSSDDDGDELNMSPLIDMVFILLIFFVVTTSFSRETGVEVNKPKAATAQTVKNESIMIAIADDGSIHILEKQVDIDQLSMIVGRLSAENPDRNALLFVDRSAPSGTVVDVIDVCNLSGIPKVNIAAVKK